MTEENGPIFRGTLIHIFRQINLKIKEYDHNVFFLHVSTYGIIQCNTNEDNLLVLTCLCSKIGEVFKMIDIQKQLIWKWEAL